MLEKSNPNFQLICTMTEMRQSQKDWKGETGLINKEMLSRHLTTLQGPIYYSAGPPAMVAGMRKMLVGAGVDEDDIRAEDFAGYESFAASDGVGSNGKQGFRGEQHAGKQA